MPQTTRRELGSRRGSMDLGWTDRIIEFKVSREEGAARLPLFLWYTRHMTD